MRKGLIVVGRAERMGLGTMTSEFCAAMQPERAVILDCRNGREVRADGIANAAIVDARRWQQEESVQNEVLVGARVVVGFETFYTERLLMRFHRERPDVRSVLFPMFEWTPRVYYALCHLLVALSVADRTECSGNRAAWVGADWPASPFIPTREVNWPPKTFVHNAGNASHNRDGTLQVLRAAHALKGTGAKLVVHHAFPLGNLAGFNPEKLSVDGVVEFRGPVDDRAALFADADVFICPRRLPGHSLPINEATGAGIPCIVNDLPGGEWAAWPYRVPCAPDAPMRFGTRNENCWAADPAALGALLRAMAMGQVERQPCPALPTWEQFAAAWDVWMQKIGAIT